MLKNLCESEWIQLPNGAAPRFRSTISCGLQPFVCLAFDILPSIPPIRPGLLNISLPNGTLSLFLFEGGAVANNRE